MKILFLFTLLFLASCGGPHITMLIHPKTGERVACRAGKNKYSQPIFQQERIDCVQQHEYLGFVQAEKLTPDQRSKIIPKTIPIVVEVESKR